MNRNSEYRVLLVDDDIDLLRISEQLLKSQHYTVSKALNGRECMESIRRRKPHLLLLDVILPDMKGTDICKAIKNSPDLSSIFIILMSGLSMDSDNISEGMETGADGYLLKPLKNRELLARVDAAFRTIRAELALAESAERFRLMADAAPVMIWQAGTDALCNYFNQPWLDFTGRRLEQELGNGWTEGIHPNDHQICQEKYRKTIEVKGPFRMEYRLRRADGEYRWIVDNGVPRFMPDGSFAGYIGSCIDITETRTVEETLRNLSQAVQQSPVSIMITDINGNIEYGNPRVFALTGYAPDELIGKNPRILSSGELPKKTYQQLWETILSGNEWKGEFHNKTKNGELYWESATISPIKNSEGKILRFLAVKEDITERKKNEKLQKESEEKYKSLSDQLEAILDHIPGLVFYKDDKNNFIRVNKFVADAYRQTKEDMEGMNLADLYPQELAETYYQDDLAVIRSGIPKLNIVEPWETADGIKWVNTCKIPFADNAGNNIGVIGMSLDITEIMQTKQELQRLNEELEARVEKRTSELEAANIELEYHLMETAQFTYIASHDLQEPLLTLTNFTSLLKEEYGDKFDEDGNKSIAYISEAANRMKLLLKGLLEYSLLGKERVMVRVDCNRVITEALADLADAIGRSHAIILLEDLPCLNGYETELRLLFQHLVGNAMKFQKKNVAPVVKISVESLESEWRFSIEDNGIGIQETSKEKVFNIFKRMQNRNEYVGTGMGLAHCKKIVELHGGKIWVESEHNIGSTFKFTIPKFDYSQSYQ